VAMGERRCEGEEEDKVEAGPTRVTVVARLLDG
jgi:hypothetical protein